MDNTIDSIIKIPDQTQYWLVRADGGKFYNEFKYLNTISIEENEVTLDKLKTEKLLVNVEQSLNHYKYIIDQIYPSKNKQQVSAIARKHHNFIEKMKIGDIVIVPSTRSSNFLIGVIISEALEKSKPKIDKEESIGAKLQFRVSKNLKYRKIHWINEVSRKELNPKIFYTLTMHQTIIDITASGDLINNLISPIYIKYGNIYACLNVNTKKPIDSESWEALYTLINYYRNDELGEVINVKSNVESPGLITLFTSFILNNALSYGFLSLIALFGNIDINGIKIKGLVPTVMDYKSNKLELQKKEIEVERDKLKLENDKERRKIDSNNNKIELMETSKKLQEMNITINTPSIKNESAEQTQMDFSNLQDEDLPEE